MKQIFIILFFCPLFSIGQFYNGVPTSLPAISNPTNVSSAPFLVSQTRSDTMVVTGSSLGSSYFGGVNGVSITKPFVVYYNNTNGAGIGIEDCHYIKVIGIGTATINGGGTNGYVKGLVDYVQVSGFKNLNGGVGGWWIKTEGPDACNYPNPLNYLYPAHMRNIWFTHNQFGNSDGTQSCGGEAVYAGSTGSYGRDPIPCLGNQKLKPLWMNGIHIDSNTIYNCGRTGIQLSGADSGTNTIIGNIIRNVGRELNSSQGAGIRTGYGTNNTTEIAHNDVRYSYIYNYDIETGSYVHHNYGDSAGYWNAANKNPQALSSFICYAQLPNSLLILNYNTAKVNTTNTQYAIYGGNNFTTGNDTCFNVGKVSVLSFPFNANASCTGTDTVCHDTTYSITHDTLMVGHFIAVTTHDSVVTDVDTTYIKHLKNQRYTPVHKLHTRTYTLRDTTAYDSVILVKGGATHDTTYQICTVDQTNIKYGYNGVWAFAGRPLSNAEVLDSLKTLELFNIFRYPGGNNSNSFNWHTGKDDDGTGQACTLSDLKVAKDSIGFDVLFVLNMLTKTLADQLQMLAAANALGIQIKYVELGNEFNNVNNPGHITFPTPQSYADTAAIWMAAIHAVYPTCMVAFIGENRNWSGGGVWNSTMLTKNPDALTWHESPNLDQFYSGGVVDVDALNNVMNADFITTGMSSITTVPIWITESNYTWDDNNIMSSDNQILTTTTMLGRLTSLIRSGNTSLKIFCVRGIESAKQGAFQITNNSITKLATAFAMDLWAGILSASQ